MSPIDHSIIERKLDAIRTNLADIELVLAKGLNAYLTNGFERKVVERSLQSVIEAAIDINLHVLKEKSGKMADNAASSFEMMAQEGLLVVDLAQSLAPSVGLRNRIVHQYDILDSKKVFEGAGKAVNLFPSYTAAILALLK